MTRRIVLAVASLGCFLSSVGYVEAQTKTGKPTPTADVVYFSRHGKTFHTNRKCLALSRASEVFEASKAEAETHGLKPCGICNRGTVGKPGNDTWGKPAPAEEKK